MNETTQPWAVVTTEYRKAQGLSYRAFAEQVNAGLVNTSVTYATIQNWEKGMSLPKMEFIWVVLVNHDDWRADWAVDMLCALLPEAFDATLDKRLICLTSRVITTTVA